MLVTITIATYGAAIIISGTKAVKLRVRPQPYTCKEDMSLTSLFASKVVQYKTSSPLPKCLPTNELNL